MNFLKITHIQKEGLGNFQGGDAMVFFQICDIGWLATIVNVYMLGWFCFGDKWIQLGA
jgi:hypothetical protein